MLWVMNARSESGDYYPCCASWKEKPTREQIDKIRVNLEGIECEKINEAFNPEDVFQAKIGKTVFRCYITSWDVKEIPNG